MRIFPLILCNIRTALAPQGPYTRAITFVANDYHVTAAATAERTVIAILLLLLEKKHCHVVAAAAERTVIATLMWCCKCVVSV